MTEEELYNEYRKSDCKSFTDFLINKIAELQHKVEVLQGYLDHDIEYDMDKAIQNLKKENAELKKGCDETQELLDKQIEATYKLDKENAELKSVQRMALYSKMSDQLTKAKEILADIIKFQPYVNRDTMFLTIGNDWKEVIYKAEQFLKEIEK